MLIKQQQNRNIREVEKKIPDTNSLLTVNVLNLKISETKNKAFAHAKYITTP